TRPSSCTARCCRSNSRSTTPFYSAARSGSIGIRFTWFPVRRLRSPTSSSTCSSSFPSDSSACMRSDADRTLSSWLGARRGAVPQAPLAHPLHPSPPPRTPPVSTLITNPIGPAIGPVPAVYLRSQTARRVMRRIVEGVQREPLLPLLLAYALLVIVAALVP